MYALSVLAPNEFYSFIVLFHINDTVVVPDEWLIGIVKPLYKNKGHPTQPKNYRLITFSSCLCKFFTGILCNSLEFFSYNLETLDTHQNII